MVEVYSTTPANSSQWPGLVNRPNRPQAKHWFAINICDNCGLSSVGSVYSMVADAGADIFCGNEMGPTPKWVVDHIFSRIPCQHLPAYNLSRAQRSRQIQLHEGRQPEGERFWHKGKTFPLAHPEDLDENFGRYSVIWLGGRVSPCNTQDNGPVFTYADADIKALPERLGIRWEPPPPQAVSFVSEVSYLDIRDPFSYSNSYMRCQPLLLARPTF